MADEAADIDQLEPQPSQIHSDSQFTGLDFLLMLLEILTILLSTICLSFHGYFGCFRLPDIEAPERLAQILIMVRLFYSFIFVFI